MNCPYCNNPIPANASNCPGCGAQIVQQQAPAPQQPQVIIQQEPQAPADEKAKSRWMAITSMVLGILSLVSILSFDEFDEEEAFGVLLFMILALVFGIVSLCQKRDGKGMAIAGIVTAAIAILLDL